MATPGFIFGGDTQFKNPEELARARMLAEALLGPQRPAQNVGEGLAVLGQAIHGRRQMNAVNRASASGQESAQGAIAKALGGMGSFPAAPAPGGASNSPVVPAESAQAASPASPVMAALDQSPSVPSSGDTSWLNYANQGATRNKPLNPKLVDALSFLPEMGVTMKVFSGGQDAEGPHRTGSHRHDHGNSGDVFFYKDGRQLDWANPQDLPIFEQIVQQGKARGITGIGAGEGYMRPGSMHIGFGSPSVWGAGGRGANAPAWLRQAYNGAGPTRVASSDPTSGVAQALSSPRPQASAQMAIASAMGAPQMPERAPVPQPNPIASALNSPQPGVTAGAPAAVTPAGQRVVQQMVSPQSMTGGAPMPMMGMPQQAQAAPPPQPAQQQTAPDNLPVMAGGNADAIPKGQLPSIQQLMEASQNPWLSEQQRGLVNMLMKQQMDAQDPNNQLDTEYKRAQIDALRTPKETAKPAGIQEYEYAKQQGFPGTFQDWEASKKGGMSLSVDPATGAVSFQQGGNMKPMTEGQSKDTVFSTRAAGALPLIDQFGDALTSLPETMGGKVPVVGNFAKSKEFQQAEQAGKEFLQAILRKDTGAAITAEETAEYGSVYLPRPGDSPELLAQKKVSRSRALEALKAGMPPQALLAQEKALAASGQATPDAPKKRLKFNPATGELE